MVKEEKDTADIQIRVSKGTLDAIEKHGVYGDKNPEGILKKILPEYETLKKTCSVVEKPEEEKKVVEPAIDAEAKIADEKPEDADEKTEEKEASSDKK